MDTFYSDVFKSIDKNTEMMCIDYILKNNHVELMSVVTDYQRFSEIPFGSELAEKVYNVLSVVTENVDKDGYVITDNYKCTDCERCQYCIKCDNCTDCNSCINCMFCYKCNNCNNCLTCHYSGFCCDNSFISRNTYYRRN